MVATSTLLRDVLFYVKNFLDSNVTDPISATRPTNQEFVMTSYPTRPVRYPLITIKDTNSFDNGAMGLQSEAAFYTIQVEVRVWCDTVSQRDKLAQEIYQKLKDNQIGPSGTSQANDIHDFKLIGSTNVDEADGPKSKVMIFQFIFVAT